MALLLSLGVISPSDVNRLRRELSSLNDFFAQAAARKAGTSMTPPRTTQLLDDLAKLNKKNLLQKEDRDDLDKQLEALMLKAPKLRISFAVEPPPRVVETILNWLRQNLDPRILLSVGLQPNIGAGCVLRTPNREFDMSMRQHLIDSRPYLAQLIEATAKKYRSAEPAPAATSPTQPAQAQPPQPAPTPPAATQPPAGSQQQ